MKKSEKRIFLGDLCFL